MHTAKIKLIGGKIEYFTKQDIEKGDKHLSLNDIKTYGEVFRVAECICKRLDVDLPGIILTPDLSEKWGYTFFKKDNFLLTDNIVALRVEDGMDRYLFTGNLAHEIRHIWQSYYNPSLVKKTYKKPGEDLLCPAEIDADGFALWYLAADKKDKPACFKKMAEEIVFPRYIVLSLGSKFISSYEQGLDLRIKKAEEIDAEYRKYHSFIPIKE